MPGEAFTKLTDDEFNLDDWISGARLPEKSVTVYGRADLVAEFYEVEQQIRARLDATPITAVIAALNVGTYIERVKNGTRGSSDRLSLITADMSLVVTVESSNPSVLLVLAAHETRPTHWSFAQERSFRAPTHFREAGGLGRV